MSTAIEMKIHPFLEKAFQARRNQIIARQAEAALRFEMADEHIEEREYDENQRLRVHRIINRKVFRGEAYERYSSLVAGLQEQGAGGADLESKVRAQLEVDLNAISAAENVRGDVGGSLRRYSELVHPEHWPSILCMARDPVEANALKSRLGTLGFTVLPADAMEKFGIVKLSCPPEMSFVNALAGIRETCSIADTLTPVTSPEPMGVTTMMVESRQLLAVTREMMDGYGQDVTLAVLDTGIDRSHPVFSRMSREDYVDFTSSGDDDTEGHGTHVASIAAGDGTPLGGRYSGIAPRCRLVMGKVLSPQRAGNLEAILRGMAWAVFEKRADVLSLSLGELGTPANGQSIWTRACDEAFRHGTVVCVAAGNPQPSYPETVVVPGDSRTAVTVGAINKQRYLAAFSAQGSTNPQSPLYGKPNCVGPGVDIVAARSSAAAYRPEEVVDPHHVRLSGTSMATPAIAGCLALLKSKARSLGWEPAPAELAELLYAACRPLRDPAGEDYRSDIEVGHGLVDMEEAMREAERRAPSRAAQNIRAPECFVTEDPHAPARSATIRARTPTSAQSGFDVCYRCGKQYLSKVGTFSPAWHCRECGAPICAVCWQLGCRECEKDKDAAAAAQNSAAGRPARASAGTDVDRGLAADRPDPAAGPQQDAGKEITSMTAPDLFSRNAPIVANPRWGETFVNRFDLNVRCVGRLMHPVSGEELKVDPRIQAQSFKRSFGEVLQFPVSAGLLKKVRITLAAVRLEEAGIVKTTETPRPADDVLRQISGSSGLDFQEDIFYCVGIFSPVGWPAEWKTHTESRSNVFFYLVEKAEGTFWKIFGSPGPLLDLFDPESQDEKMARARRALGANTRLVIPGDQVAVDSFLEENRLTLGTVEEAIRESRGRFQVIEHKGKSYIQRSIG